MDELNRMQIVLADIE